MTTNRTKPMSDAEKAEAKLAADARNAAIIAENVKSRGILLETAGKYGREAAAGQTSLTALAYFFNDACRHGFATEGDARSVYVAYAEAHNAAIEAGSVVVGNTTYKVAADKLIELGDNETPVSEFRTFGRPNVVLQGLGLYQDVIEAASRVTRENRVGSVYVCMVAVNRRISDATKGMDEKAVLEWKVTPDMVAAWIAKPAKSEVAPKTFAEKLDKLVLDMAKLVKKADDENCPDLRAVYDALELVQVDFKRATIAARIAPEAALSKLVKPDSIGEVPATLQ